MVFQLRVKSKSGQKTVDDLTAEDDVTKLKSKLTEVTGIKSEALHVLYGFPPKPLDLNKGSATLKVLGINSGDTLIIEERQETQSNDSKSSHPPRRHIDDEAEFRHNPGVLMKQVVPADNSCLFTSIGYVLGGKIDPSVAPDMRTIIASTVQNNPEDYSEAILNKPNAEYCSWILKSESWGGAIEISILSHFYGLEIAVVDCVNGIVNRFGEDQQFFHRVFLIFDGIHYDPLYLEPLDGGSIQTMFPAHDEEVLRQALEIATEAKSCRQYTDVQKFTLKCMKCDVRFTGHIAAQRHAKETGHMNFGEV